MTKPTATAQHNNERYVLAQTSTASCVLEHVNGDWYLTVNKVRGHVVRMFIDDIWQLVNGVDDAARLAARLKELQS